MSITTSDLWVRRYHPRPDAPVRLVCFPHAGSSAPYFVPVSAGAGPGVDVTRIPLVLPQLLLSILLFPIIGRLAAMFDRLRLLRVKVLR